jgi:acetyltransferase-like isoleucine patch superfamily enzyme
MDIRKIFGANVRRIRLAAGISQEAVVRRSILGRHCHIGRNALVEDGVVLGDKSVITDYSRL